MRWKTIGVWLLMCVLVVWGVLAAGGAFAADDPGAGEVLAGFLTGTVFPVIGALLLGLIGVLLDKLRQKYNIEVSVENEARLMTFAEQGIAFAEEKAAEAVKRGVSKYSGREKLDLAIGYVLSHAPKVSKSQAEEMVTVALARLFDVGATGKQAV